jgi:hypothetical protein
MLERILTELRPAPLVEPEAHPRGPRILTTSELESVRADLIARLAGS